VPGARKQAVLNFVKEEHHMAFSQEGILHTVAQFVACDNQVSTFGPVCAQILILPMFSHLQLPIRRHFGTALWQ